MNNLQKPDWIRTKLTSTSNFSTVHQTIQQHQLHTICKSGKCPNLSECWNRGTATFMILGEICTRSCKFCNTATGCPLPPDPAESQAIAEAIYFLKLKHAVITSVDRDDLPDKGASFWAKTIHAIQAKNPHTTIE
ncbi:MAG TPA: lipoyl synthase, partial [Paludibacteraceae bacterium]|nr:lipoyl synthase [Paludibacteraceae bacterium]